MLGGGISTSGREIRLYACLGDLRTSSCYISNGSQLVQLKNSSQNPSAQLRTYCCRDFPPNCEHTVVETSRPLAAHNAQSHISTCQFQYQAL